jgi:hypothetical protein
VCIVGTIWKKHIGEEGSVEYRVIGKGTLRPSIADIESAYVSHLYWSDRERDFEYRVVEIHVGKKIKTKSEICRVKTKKAHILIQVEGPYSFIRSVVRTQYWSVVRTQYFQYDSALLNKLLTVGGNNTHTLSFFSCVRGTVAQLPMGFCGWMFPMDFLISYAIGF